MAETARAGAAAVVPSLNPTDRLTDTVDGLLQAEAASRNPTARLKAVPASNQ